MKLSIDETQTVIHALQEWAVIVCDDEELNKDTHKLRNRFIASLKKKQEYKKNGHLGRIRNEVSEFYQTTMRKFPSDDELEKICQYFVEKELAEVGGSGRK